MAAAAIGPGCHHADPPSSITIPPATKTIADSQRFRPETIGAEIGPPPWIAHVLPVDLDRDGLLDVVACEARENKVVWIRQIARSHFQEQTIASELKAPVHIDAGDIDGDGDVDLVVAIMGYIFPNNDRIGTVIVLENDGRQNFTPHTILDHTERVTDARIVDLNGDGQMDLAVAQFGYDQGAVRWLERTGTWEFRPHDLLDLSGAINVCVGDFNGDGHPDLVCLVSQQWEEIHYFENNGRGVFAHRRVWGSTNEDYGSSGISVCDLNGDGRPDILYTNGDGFGPSAVPGPRPWHGIQWLENNGSGYFRYHRVADLPSAYSPLGVDLDGDGAMDIVVTSAYADWDHRNPNIASLVWYRNDGHAVFTPHVLAVTPKDLITVGAGDFSGNGHPQLVTGGFYVSAPYERMGRVTRWVPNSP